ncbi:MAG: DNA/RNA endonuclease G [uncultured Sulfurovum sp.]|uniref:DNA/RNA endonuclease G n=1 Tax=uncultured Sulfurovum sp. TaxID=269237 RepID=A0A6S6SMK5_9BACT|nr:MAG: DNA/RNA endonuclease G [uncultured Sulfurovum sp.]
MIDKSIFLAISLFFVACGGGSTGGSTQQNEDEISYKTKFVDENNCSKVIDNEFIIMCYDYQKKAVKSVFYTLYGDLVNETNIQKRPSFHVEKNLLSKDRTSTTDYTNSGYDKGHMAPDAAFDWSQESLDAVYTLANVIPQAPQVNRNSWAKLEAYVRDKSVELGELNIVNVVKYGEISSRMGKSQMAISNGYYKILYNKDENYEECFYYSNQQGVSTQGDILEDHIVSCAVVSN